MFKFSRLLPETPKEEIKLKLNHSWQLFHIPEIRDLAWLLLSPPLVKVCENFPTLKLIKDEQLAIDWLKSLDNKAITTVPQRKQFKRLGLYFEALIHFVLSQAQQLNFVNYRQLNSHLQVKSNSSTLGEVDFILQNKSKQNIHLEATVKFYLQKKSAKNELKNSRTQWVGPNTVDRLDKKFNKLFSKQLALSTKPQFAEQYPEYGDITQRSHIFAGMLFHHWCDKASTPQGINRDCLRGHWLTRSEFAVLIEKQCYAFTRLEKLDWLGADAALQASEKKARQTPSSNGNKVQCFTRHSLQCSESNTGRIMVVPDYWPNEKPKA